MGFSSVTGDETIMFSDNVSFDGTQRGGKITTNGQLLIGSTAAPHIKVGQLTSPLGTLTIGYSSPNITIDLTGGSLAVDSFAMQTGTSPVLPNVAGLVTFNGSSVAAGTNPVRTNGIGANSMQLEVQISQAIAATDATKIGLCNFDSAAFDVDANGFVQLNGGGIAATSFTVDANTAPGTNPVVPTAAGGVTIEAAAVAAHSVPIETRSRAANTFKVEIQESAAVAATDATKSGISHFDSARFTVDANGFVSVNGSGLGETITGNTGGALSPTAGNWNILGTNSALTGYSPWTSGSSSTLTLNMPGTVKWVVNATANLGTHTTIQAAITAASSGDDIFITPGTYTENLTLKAGVNLVAYMGDANTPNVTISGNATATFAGTCSISNIRLQTNSAAFLTVSGSSNTIVNLNSCYLNCTNNTGISYSSSGASSGINFNNCKGDLGTTGIALYSSSGVGNMIFDYCFISNSGASTTASSSSAGTVFIRNSNFSICFSTSSVATLSITNSVIATDTINTTCITLAGTGTSTLANCYLASGTASTLSIGSGTTLGCLDNAILSSNTNPVTGAGSILYGGLTFGSTSSNINVTTQTIRAEGPSRTIGSSNSGNTNTLTVTNSSNTASSNALENITVGGTSAGDPFTTYTVSGTTNWSQGIDNSVTGDPYVIAASTALGTTNVMSAATGGSVNWPLQPAFMAFLASSDNNVTGAGTSYTLGTNVAFTEVFDQNSNFNTNGTFTAPVTGRYCFQASIFMGGLTAAMTASQFALVTSNRTVVFAGNNIGAIRNVSNQATLGGSVLTDMDVGDTATLSISISNGAGDVADVLGQATNPLTYFSGYLVA